MADIVKTPLELCCESLNGKRFQFILGGPCKIARITPEEYSNAIIKGRGLKGWKYLLARLVHSRMGDIRYPYMRMTAYRWELLVWPDGTVTMRVIHPFPMPGRMHQIRMDFDLGRVQLSSEQAAA
jgi:hypothetical protein